MKTLRFLCFLLLISPLPAQVLQTAPTNRVAVPITEAVMTDTNALLVQPTNFFQASSNFLAAALSGYPWKITGAWNWTNTTTHNGFVITNGQWQMWSNNAKISEVNPLGLLAVSPGNASMTALHQLGNTNTGIYFGDGATSNAVVFSVAGTEAFDITAPGALPTLTTTGVINAANLNSTGAVSFDDGAISSDGNGNVVANVYNGSGAGLVNVNMSGGTNTPGTTYPIINVRDFGALGVSGNDSAAILAAIHVWTNTGGTLYFPHGSYGDSNSYAIDFFNVINGPSGGGYALSNLRIQGDGMGSTVWLGKITNAAFLTFAHGLPDFSDLTISGLATGGTNSGVVNLGSCGVVSLRNFEVTGWNWIGLDIEGGAAGGTWFGGGVSYCGIGARFPGFDDGWTGIIRLDGCTNIALELGGPSSGFPTTSHVNGHWWQVTGARNNIAVCIGGNGVGDTSGGGGIRLGGYIENSTNCTIACGHPYYMWTNGVAMGNVNYSNEVNGIQSINVTGMGRLNNNNQDFLRLYSPCLGLRIADLSNQGQSNNVHSMTNICDASPVILEHVKGGAANFMTFNGSSIGGTYAGYTPLQMFNQDEYDYLGTTLIYARILNPNLSGYPSFNWYLNSVFTGSNFIGGGLTVSNSLYLSTPGGSSTWNLVPDNSGHLNINTGGSTIGQWSSFGKLFVNGALEVGSGFTLDAGSVTLPSHSVANAALQTDVALTDAANTFTLGNTFSGANIFGVAQSFTNNAGAGVKIEAGNGSTNAITVRSNLVNIAGSDTNGNWFGQSVYVTNGLFVVGGQLNVNNGSAVITSAGKIVAGSDIWSSYSGNASIGVNDTSGHWSRLSGGGSGNVFYFDNSGWFGIGPVAATNTSTPDAVKFLKMDGSTGYVSIGNGFSPTPSSLLQVAGPIATAVASYTANHTITAADSIVCLSNATLTATLPTAIGIPGREYTVIVTTNSSGTVATTSAQTISGSSTYSLPAQNSSVTVWSDNANWWIKCSH